jgi:hypothetical protein
MFHLIPIQGGKKSPAFDLPLAFLGQFLVVAILILLFVLYAAGVRIG